MWYSASVLSAVFLSIAMARPRIRNSYNLLHVYSPWTNLGWRVTHNIDVAKGEAKVRLGVFRHVYDELGKLLGYQPVVQVTAPQDSTFSDASRAALGCAEMRANAGLMGRSRTARLSEIDKQCRLDERTGKLLPAEDFVERVQVLVREIYPQSANFAIVNGRCGDRAVRVYPRMVAR
jgi:hypothetical protein